MALCLFAGCTEPVPRDAPARFLVMGDSMLAWNRQSEASVSHAMENLLGAPVIDRAVIGAHVNYRLPISGALGFDLARQYRSRAWEWVVLNGGGNDLWLGCGCDGCDARLDRILASDGSNGRLAEIIGKARGDGAQVIYVGYLPGPEGGGPLANCRNEIARLEARVAILAQRDPGLHFLSLTGLVPPGETSFHAADRIHPSPKASREMARAIVRIIDARH